MKARVLAVSLFMMPPVLLADPQSAAQASGTSYKLYVANPDAVAYACTYEVTLSYAVNGMPETKRYAGDFTMSPQQGATAVMDLHSKFANLTERKPPAVKCVSATAGAMPSAAPMTMPSSAPPAMPPSESLGSPGTPMGSSSPMMPSMPGMGAAPAAAVPPGP